MTSSAATTRMDDKIAGRAIPFVDADNQPFYDACGRGVLLIQRCVETQKLQFYPRPCSVFTGGPVEWVECSGLGEVHTFTIIRRNFPEPQFSAALPYVVAIIQLEEGVRMMSNLTGCEPELVRIGMKVEVYFACVDEETQICLPFWRPLPAERG